jgi:DNA-binding MarR family transcriptional regulator
MERKQELFDEFIVQSTKLKRCMEQRSHIPVGEKVATMLQTQALSYIQDNPLVTVSNLAHHLALSSSANAQLLDRLLESKWVDRNHDEEDRRIYHLSLTAQGKEKLEELQQLKKKRFENMLSVLSEAELESLVQIFKRLNSSLDEHQPKE